jgi:hypothetical protein
VNVKRFLPRRQTTKADAAAWLIAAHADHPGETPEAEDRIPPSKSS